MPTSQNEGWGYATCICIPTMAYGTASGSASLLLELSQILSEKAHEMASSDAGTGDPGASSDLGVGDRKGKRSRFEPEKGSKTWKSGKRRTALSLSSPSTLALVIPPSTSLYCAAQYWYSHYSSVNCSLFSEISSDLWRRAEVLQKSLKQPAKPFGSESILV